MLLKGDNMNLQNGNLPDKVESACRKLNNSYKKYEKNNRIAIVLGLVAVVMVVLFFVLIPEGESIYDHPETSFPVGIIFVITMTLALYYQKNAKKDDHIGYEKHVILVYRAYNFLNKYAEDEDLDYLDKAGDQIDSLVIDLNIEFGDFEATKPSIKSLHEPLGNFIEYLDIRLVPALDAEEKINVEKFQKTFQKLIEFFFSDDFDHIKAVNSDLKDNYLEQTEEVKPLIKQIQEHRQVTKIVITSLIIGGSSLVSYIVSLAVGADTITTITWLIAISVPSAIAYLWWKSSH